METQESPASVTFSTSTIGYISTCCTWSPNGNQIAFFSGIEVFIYDLDTGASERLFENPYNSNLNFVNWSPDGTYITAIDNRQNLFVIATLTGEIIRAFEGVYMSDWSPNGTELTYVTDEGVYIFDLALGQLESIANRDDLGDFRYFGADVLWSPDGSQIALLYNQTFGGTVARLYHVFSRTLTEPLNLSIDLSSEMYITARWERDSTRLFFVTWPSQSTINGDVRFYSWEVATGNVQRLFLHDLQMISPEPRP